MNGRRFPPVLRGSEQVIAGLEPKLVERRDDARYAAVPFRIGQTFRAVDYGEGLGVTLHAGDETCAKIKHLQTPREVSQRHRRPPRVLERSRCSGTNDRRDIPAVPPRLDWDDAGDNNRGTSGYLRCKTRIAAHDGGGTLPAKQIAARAPAQGLRR